MTDTIVALASPPGRSSRGVVRLSGPRAHALARTVFVPGTAGEARGSSVVPGSLELRAWPAVAATLWVFRAPRSYTGEDSCEIHLPGSPPLLSAVLSELARAGARPAAPGEFTRRAFLSGRLDLAQAEAVLALTRAEAEGEVRSAARALLGGLRAAVDRTKETVLGILAHVEAAIDFPEDELPGLDPATALAARAERAALELAAVDRSSIASRVPRGEPTVVLAGRANAGKSTLLNALAGKEVAIVSPHAGTTRDTVSAQVELEGVSVRLVDTAGDMSSRGEIEREALERARDARRTADLVVRVVDVSTHGTGPVTLEGLVPTLDVGTKLDLVSAGDRDALSRAPLACLVSAVTGEGLGELRARIAGALAREALSPDLVQTERQARLVSRARASLERAAALLGSREPARSELAAVDLRAALESLGELTGAVATDDLLDRIFGEFCIGK